MIAPIITFLNNLLTQAGGLALPLIGLALLFAGAIMVLGNHHKGREGIICALIGGAVMLSAQTIAAAVHP